MLKRLASIQTSKNVYGFLDFTSLKYAPKEKKKKAPPKRQYTFSPLLKIIK